MKLIVSIVLFFAFIPLSKGQDTIIRIKNGRIELSKKGLSNVYEVKGFFNSTSNNLGSKNKWVEGQVRKIEYEYIYVRTYNGSTQPANSAEFYKPIKRIGYYYFPVSDITIWYNDSNRIAQQFKMDSCILRSYYENGTIKSIHYFNKNLGIDSIFQYYSNGKLKLKQLGDWKQTEENLMLGFSNTAWLLERKKITSKVEIEYHGNGFPQCRIEFEPTEEELIALNKARTSKELPVHRMEFLDDRRLGFYYNRAGYKNTYTLYDLNGNPTTDSYITSDHTWTGTKYEYYENGNLNTKKELFRNQANGIWEFRDKNGDLSYRQYYRKQHCDSTIYYRKIQDTVFSWKAPTHFGWSKNGIIESVRNPNVCIFEFNQDGSLRSCSFEGYLLNSDKTKKDEYLVVTHSGEKDKYGLPNGRWLGINKFQDTVYDVHFKHGYLHGKYNVELRNKHLKFTRHFYMGLECDSSVQFYKGINTNTIYYSSPGKYSKKIERYSDGSLHRIDTSLNGKTFIKQLLFHNDGWIIEESKIDTTNRRIHFKYFSAKDQLEIEKWKEHYYSEIEWKTYYPGTNQVKQHWVYTGTSILPSDTKKEKYDERGELIEVVSEGKAVRNAIRKTYDQNGNLIEEVKLQDGVVIK